MVFNQRWSVTDTDDGCSDALQHCVEQPFIFGIKSRSRFIEKRILRLGLGGRPVSAKQAIEHVEGDREEAKITIDAGHIVKIGHRTPQSVS